MKKPSLLTFPQRKVSNKMKSQNQPISNLAPIINEFSTLCTSCSQILNSSHPPLSERAWSSDGELILLEHECDYTALELRAELEHTASTTCCKLCSLMLNVWRGYSHVNTISWILCAYRSDIMEDTRPGLLFLEVYYESKDVAYKWFIKPVESFDVRISGGGVWFFSFILFLSLTL